MCKYDNDFEMRPSSIGQDGTLSRCRAGFDSPWPYQELCQLSAFGQPMTKQSKHHFVPEFHLKKWSHADGRLRRWGRVYDGRLQQDRVSPGGTGYRPGLNSLQHVPDSEIERVEKEHFGPIDAKASVALQRMIEQQEMSYQGKIDFAQYINSLLVRGPSYLEPLKQSAPERLRELLAQHDVEFNQIKGDRPEHTFFDYLQNTSPERIANAGLTAVQLQAREGKLPDLLAS